MSDKVLKEAYAKIKFIEEGDDLHTQAIDLMDDMLALEQYSEKADIYRHILKCLQGMH